MTREELIGYCRYYKGEEECPHETGTDNGIFWNIEKMYVENSIDDDKWSKGWESSAMSFVKDNKDNESVVRTKDFPVQTKGIYMYVCQMIAKWMPYNDRLYACY